MGGMMFEFPLPTPRDTSYTRLGIGPEATTDEVRDAAARYVSSLKAGSADPDKLAEANKLKDLATTKERERYDAEHPPLGLLRLEPMWEGVFGDRAERLVVLAVLRRELEAFLVHRGWAVRFPSDLTRTDFTEDFAYSPLLDGRRIS